MSDDWLDGGPIEENPLGWLVDDPAKISKNSVVAKAADDKYAEIVRAMRKLDFRQRMMVKCLINSQMHKATAIRKFNEVMVRNGHRPIDRSDGYRLINRGDFQAALDLYTEAMLKEAKLDNPSATLVRIDSVVEDALTPVPMISNGQPVVLPGGQMMMEVDRGNALKGLEMIGKTQGIFRKDEETQQRVTVVLDFSGEKPAGEAESEIIDGEFTEIPKE